MKTMLLIGAFFVASLAFANPQLALNTYEVKNHTCNELNTALTNEMAIEVIYNSFFGGKGVHFAKREYCPVGYISMSARVRAADGWCRLGYKCKLPPREGRRDD